MDSGLATSSRPGMTRKSVRVARGEVARDLRAFLDVAADRDGGRRRAASVGLLKTVIAAVEAGDHAGAAFAGWGFGIDKGLHLAAPFVALVGPADAAQIVQPAKDLGQALQIGVKRRRHVLGPGGRGGAGENQGKNGQKSRGHRPVYASSRRGTQGGRNGRQGAIRRWADWITSSSPPVSLRSPRLAGASGATQRKSSSSSFRTGSLAVQRAAKDMIR